MKKITVKELKKSFEESYNYEYKSKEEFVRAVESEYSIDFLEDVACRFSDGDVDFIVTDWADYCSWTY